MHTGKFLAAATSFSCFLRVLTRKIRQERYGQIVKPIRFSNIRTSYAELHGYLRSFIPEGNAPLEMRRRLVVITLEGQRRTESQSEEENEEEW